MEVYEPIELPRLSPALTPAQRLHLELHGYVVVEGAVAPERVARVRDLVYELEERVRGGAVLPPPAHLHSGGRLWFRIDNLPHLDPVFLEHLTDPLLWGMAEEALGGDARLEQSDVSIHRRDPDTGGQEHFGFHRGAFDGMAWTGGGLYHFPFVKTLTLLTDVGPDDGGTVVVPGSHRLTDDALPDALAVLAEHPELAHQVVAPAGSTLLFYESTVHAGGDLRSDNDRMYLVGGYTPTMYQPWHEYDPDPAWLETLSPSHRVFLSGANRWLWRPRVRKLGDPQQSLDDATAAAVRHAESARASGERRRELQRREAELR